MDTITALTTIRDNLRSNLTDPFTLTSPAGVARGGGYWVFCLEPVTAAKYPIIEIKKADNPTEVIDIGPDYMESERVFMNIFFYSKNGFRITVATTTYLNEAFVEYYMGQIKAKLKSQFSTLHTAGVGSYRHHNTSKVGYDPEGQLYFGFVTISVRFFHT